MDDTCYDMAIIGGGINGVGIARDAAGRGLRVLLVEKGDLAQGTSSSSSKLIHGGLRYLEHREFRLVRESLTERETLMKIAPHIIWPMDFILPHNKGMRPAWMLRAGLMLYDNLAAGSSLRGSNSVVLGESTPYGKPLKSRLSKGFRYTDCWVDDARLVILNAQDAEAHGADIRTRTACAAVERHAEEWRLFLQSSGSEKRTELRAKILVNAAGPWANAVNEIAGVKAKGKVKLVKGSHIVVPQIHSGNHAYILQLPDKRIIFVLPFEDEFSLIGTTDIAYEGDPIEAGISEEEIRYLLDGVNSYLPAPLTREDMVWNYSGVRALYDDNSDNLSTITRDYVLELNAQDKAPLLSIFGGKITTYRRLAEQAMEKLQPFLEAGTRSTWTGETPLPGSEAYSPPPWLDAALVKRWRRQYGSAMAKIIGDAESMEGLGKAIALNVYEAELHYVQTHEWVQKADDFLWRRTKLGLQLEYTERDKVIAWFKAQQKP
ncbi:MAG: glycerol-3-phosphate dehydrogenase [Alphaproteobacteria bacterium]|nr:glycerol-3-phosphate dehydrogenase [Alphaproteobacteria bacterium]